MGVQIKFNFFFNFFAQRKCVQQKLLVKSIVISKQWKKTHTGPSMSGGSCVVFMTSYGTAQVSSCMLPDAF